MALKYGVNYTNAFQTVPAVLVDSSKYGGRVKAMSDSFALSADLGAGDKIYLGKLPKGAVIHEVVLAFSDLDAAGGTVDVGYEFNEAADSALVDDLDAFLSVVDVTAAGSKAMSVQDNMPGFLHEMEGNADLVATIVGDTDASSGTVKVSVLYSE